MASPEAAPSPAAPKGDASAFDDSTFAETFGTFEIDEETNNGENNRPDIESYDPFDIGGSPPKKKSPIKKKKDPVMNKAKVVKKVVKSQSAGPSAMLPPRLTVNFKIHEEISSLAYVDIENEGASEILVQGGLFAQVTSSDALKNSPFILAGTSKATGEPIDIIPNMSYARTYESRGEQSKISVIKIPKTEVNFVPVGSFRFSERIDHMPLLLEKRVTRKQNKVQIAIQVRSKLTNAYDLTDLSITLGISDPVVEDYVEINVGEGDFDKVQRTITWKLTSLEKGDSFMVSARALVNEDTPDTAMQFPVVLRCSSLDQISTGEFEAVEASGYPATLTSTIVSKTFRMIHRLK